MKFLDFFFFTLGVCRLPIVVITFVIFSYSQGVMLLRKTCFLIENITKCQKQVFLVECVTHDSKVHDITGDERVNEQPALTSMHMLWLTVHENLVTQFAALNPHWDDEKLYQVNNRCTVLLRMIVFRVCPFISCYPILLF